MADSSAREEADRFFSNKDRLTAHPHDACDSDHSDIEEKNTTTEPQHSDPGDDEDTLHSMSATSTAAYYLPPTLFDAKDARTGPKGVISDARAFHRAKKQSLRNTFLNLAASSYFQPSSKVRWQSPSRTDSDSTEKPASGLDEEDDDAFMERWRQERLEELRAGGPYAQQRRQSPSKRKWGFFKEVDGNGYLDAVEKTASDTVVVVCIYDPEVCCRLFCSTCSLALILDQSDESAAVEDSLHTLSQKHVTTRFVRLHHEIAELQNVGVPAIIAYQNGEVIAMMTDCTAVGLETNLQRSDCSW